MKRDILTASVRDFFTPTFLGMAFVPFLITLILLFVLLFMFTAEIISALQATGDGVVAGDDTLSMLKHHFVTTVSEYPIISLIAGHAIFQWLMGILFYIIGGSLALLLAMVIAVIVTGFFTPWIVRTVQRRHYSGIELKGQGNIFTYLLFATKILLVFFLLFLFSLPFYFIPVVNLLAINLPFYYLFHNLIVKDVAGEVNDGREMKRILKATRPQLMASTLLLYFVTLVPIAGIFLQVYFVIFIAHFFLKETEELREVERLKAGGLTG